MMGGVKLDFGPQCNFVSVTPVLSVGQRVLTTDGTNDMLGTVLRFENGQVIVEIPGYGLGMVPKDSVCIMLGDFDMGAEFRVFDTPRCRFAIVDRKNDGPHHP